ncbi:MAG: hypothetical protein RO009_10930 [Pseudorhodoplanes sp.]|jgi:hypothetical protein|nr:hypothetical protein [Pseudorhodoplanes sp.]
MKRKHIKSLPFLLTLFVVLKKIFITMARPFCIAQVADHAVLIQRNAPAKG